MCMAGAADVDRFSARCRLPPGRVRARPRAMSRFVVVRDASASSGARDALFLCRAALLASEHSEDDDDEAQAPRFDSSVRLAARATLFRDLSGAPASADGSAQWVPRTAVRDAVAVTLEALADEQLPRLRAWLADVEFRQVLAETLQRRLLLCRGAVVRLPQPSGLADARAPAVEFRVASVYPDASFVCVTHATRVTLTTPDDVNDASVPGDSTVAPQQQRTTTTVAPPPTPIGGLAKEQAALRDMLLLPVEHAELGARCGLEFPKGLLLCGPPGVGKTLLVRVVVHQCRERVPLQLKVVNGAEIMTSGVGDAETALRAIFLDASAFARRSSGAGVIFIDELDALCPKRDAGSASAHSRVVAQLLTLLDGVDTHARGNVIVVGATNLPNSIDPALRRPGRFDRELFIAPPGAAERCQIFRMHMQEMPVCVRRHVRGDPAAEDDDNALAAARTAFIEALARKSVGYVGADIAALCREALAVATTRQFVALAEDRELSEWWSAWKRQSKPLYNANFSAVVAGNAWGANPVAIPLWFVSKAKQQERDTSSFFGFLLKANGASDEIDTSDSLYYAPPTVDERADEAFEVTMADFEQAMQVVVASSLRGAAGFSKDFERLGWDSIGGQEGTKLALQQALEWPIKYPQTFTRLGVKPPRGILLYGPPGCSKSTIVRAAAHSSGATFLTLSAAKVFSPFFGDAEASVRQVFRDARAALPAIVFFDEIDVLVAKRQFDGSGDSGSSSAMRVMSTLLNEMDGVESADGLLVIGATNRPDCIDAALLRPGRFDRILYVDLPTEGDRLQILQIHSKPMQLADDVDLPAIASRTPFFSGAELENVCREAALHALRESISAEVVRMWHFEDALATTVPGASPASLRQYREFAEKMGHLS